MSSNTSTSRAPVHLNINNQSGFLAQEEMRVESSDC